MLVRYLGHSAFYVEGSDVKLLIDPFLSGNPKASASADSFQEMDYIFVTHGHGDHLGDTVDIAKRTGAIVVCNYEISVYLSDKGVSCHPMHIGGSYAFSFGRVKMTPALHGSGIQTDHGMVPGGMAGGFLLEVDGKKLYHAGDTGLTKEMELLRDEGIEVAMIPIGGNFTMDIQDGARASDMIRPNHVIPMHYDTFEVIKVDPEAFAAMVGGVVDVVILKPGEERVFPLIEISDQ